MGTHLYADPGPRNTRTSNVTRQSMPTTRIELHDGVDHVQLSYTDLDALDETCRLFMEARANHIAAMLDGRSETIVADELAPDDLAVIDGELVMIDTTIVDGEYLIVRYGRRYMDTYDMTGDRSIRLARRASVRRLLADVTLAVVR